MVEIPLHVVELEGLLELVVFAKISIISTYGYYSLVSAMLVR